MVVTERGIYTLRLQPPPDKATKPKEISHSESVLNTPEQNLASVFYQQLKAMVIDFNRHLNDNQELGIRLVSFGQTMTFHVERIGYSNPSLIIFVGVSDDGHPLTLVQHVSQINFLLMAVPKPGPELPRRHIGFLDECTPDVLNEGA